MFMVASGILTVADIELIAGTLLGFLTGDIAFALLGHDTVDETFLRLEVVSHGLRLVRSVALLEDGGSVFHTQGILETFSKHHAAIHVHGNHRGGQLDVLVIDLTITEQVDESALSEHDRVVGLVDYRSVQRLFLLFLSQRIGTQRVYGYRILRHPITITTTSLCTRT